MRRRALKASVVATNRVDSATARSLQRAQGVGLRDGFVVERATIQKKKGDEGVLMAATVSEPLRFEPILKRLIWGGRRLGTVLGKSLGDHDDYAESWEISDHHDDVSVVCEGALAGQNLRALVHESARELLGPAAGTRAQFPLLVKFIDAHQNLSVQVHPDDVLGPKLAGDNGKTEAWVILDAEPGALIYAGLKPGVARDEFAAALEAGKVEPLLHRFEAKAGDCVLIAAGTLHAIGAGVLLVEVQQMSDATFRVYDWGRVAPDGRPRKLHLTEALEATKFEFGPVNPLASRPETIAGGTREPLARSPYFELTRLRLTGPSRVGAAARFTILVGLEGNAEVVAGGVARGLAAGQTLLLPASLGEVEIRPAGARATVLTCVAP